jgi:hypothetical protein
VQDKWLETLSSFDIATGESTELYPIEAEQFTDVGRNLSVSKDGSSAFYTRFDKSKNDIVLMDL